MLIVSLSTGYPFPKEKPIGHNQSLAICSPIKSISAISSASIAFSWYKEKRAGEIVWRCARRAEHGKKFCKHSPSVSEERTKERICEELSMSAFDEDEVKDQADTILIHSDGSLRIEL